MLTTTSSLMLSVTFLAATLAACSTTTSDEASVSAGTSVNDTADEPSTTLDDVEFLGDLDLFADIDFGIAQDEDIPSEPGELVPVECPESYTNTELLCLIVTVPLDYDNPAQGNTEISMGVWVGSDAGQTMVMLQGGPGGASSQLADFYPPQSYTQVFIDQRGTGFSGNSLDCTEYDEVIIAAWEATGDEADLIGDAALADCATRLNADPLVAHTNSKSHAADVAYVMELLDSDNWMLYGVSYGSTIALEVLRDPPPELQAVVLDGVYPPDIDQTTALARSARRALDSITAACEADVYCASVIGDVNSTMNELIERLNANPVEVPLAAEDTRLGEALTVSLDGDLLADIVFDYLYQEYLISFVPALLAGVFAGDERLIHSLTAFGVDYDAALLAQVSEGTYFAVSCSDRLATTTPPPEGLDAFQTVVLGEGLAPDCAHWDVPSAPPAQPVSSELPVLMLAGQFDPITPVTLARQAAVTLVNSVVVEREGLSHGIWASGDACVDAIAADFVADPRADVDISCSYEANPMRFIAL